MPSLITIRLQQGCPHCGNLFTIAAAGAGTAAAAADAELRPAIVSLASLPAKS